MTTYTVLPNGQVGEMGQGSVGGYAGPSEAELEAIGRGVQITHVKGKNGVQYDGDGNVISQQLDGSRSVQLGNPTQFALQANLNEQTKELPELARKIAALEAQRDAGESIDYGHLRKLQAAHDGIMQSALYQRDRGNQKIEEENSDAELNAKLLQELQDQRDAREAKALRDRKKRLGL